MQPTDKVSTNLTLKECTKSATAIKLGISNLPTEEHLKNIKAWAVNIFEPLRKGLGNNPIFVSCMYRSLALNKATPGASLTSFHPRGMAGDLDDTFGYATNKEIFKYIYENLEFAELIWEHGDDNNPDWVHVAFEEGKNVKEVLETYVVIVKGEPKTKYRKFNIDKLK